MENVQSGRASRLRPRAGSSAKSVLLTLLGELVLPRSGRAWTQSLVDSLALLDVEEKNARQALLRLANQGFIEGERVGRRVRWGLTPAGRDLLSAGTERIYNFGLSGGDWDGRWLVVLCSVPEDQRAKRHQLRSRLEFAGFGFLGPGTAITPHADREATAGLVLADLDLIEGAAVFRAEAGDLVPAEDLLRRAWDLDALGRRYEEFLSSFQARSPQTPDAELAALVALVHEWRRFPFIDPEIPDRLLPAGWVGRQARAFFDERHARWSPGAKAAFEELEAASA
jgi:phenylacetic acid degradation operon negative regulatory protein